jgi:hypothetical protein
MVDILTKKEQEEGHVYSDLECEHETVQILADKETLENEGGSILIDVIEICEECGKEVNRYRKSIDITT